MVNQIRLYIDEDASRNSFVLALRNLDFDVVTTAKAENLGLADLVRINIADLSSEFSKERSRNLGK